MMEGFLLFSSPKDFFLPLMTPSLSVLICCYGVPEIGGNDRVASLVFGKSAPGFCAELMTGSLGAQLGLSHAGIQDLWDQIQDGIKINLFLTTIFPIFFSGIIFHEWKHQNIATFSFHDQMLFEQVPLAQLAVMYT